MLSSRGKPIPRPHPAPEHAERGSATAEFAVVLPCITLLLAVVIGAGACGATAVQAEEAARLGARAAARGQPEAEVRRVVAGVAGEDADVRISAGPAEATVRVSHRAPGVIGEWTGMDLDATARASVERTAAQDAEGGDDR